MKAIRRPDQYLRLRGDIWHYVRRVPKAVSHIDDRTLIYRSLDTDSRKVARQRRDLCADEDEQRWHGIVPSRFNIAPREVTFREVSQHARSLGFNYEPMDSLISRDNAATEKLESMTSKAHVAAQSGRLIEGTVSQKYELPHGPHAMIETQRAFYLVPWESTHAQKWGKRIKGCVLSGGGIDWDAGRSRGIGR